MGLGSRNGTPLVQFIIIKFRNYQHGYKMGKWSSPFFPQQRMIWEPLNFLAHYFIWIKEQDRVILCHCTSQVTLDNFEFPKWTFYGCHCHSQLKSGWISIESGHHFILTNKAAFQLWDVSVQSCTEFPLIHFDYPNPFRFSFHAKRFQVNQLMPSSLTFHPTLS